MNAQDEKTLLEKLKTLPPARLAEVENFVDFLRSREADQHLTRAAARASEPARSRPFGITPTTPSTTGCSHPPQASRLPCVFSSATSCSCRFRSPTSPPPGSDPGVIVSSAAYHRARRDLLLMAITSQVRG